MEERLNPINRQPVPPQPVPEDRRRHYAIKGALVIIALIGATLGALSIIGYIPPSIGGIGFGVSISAALLFIISYSGSSKPQAVLKMRDLAAPEEEREEEAEASDEAHVKEITLITSTDNSYQKMDQLVDDGQVEAAWELYLATAVRGGLAPDLLSVWYLSQASWEYLPSEKLAGAFFSHWHQSQIDINKKVCSDFVRDCAITYQSIRDLCLKEDSVWSSFNGVQENLVDIASHHPDFGIQVMVSKRGTTIAGDLYRMEIFRNCFDELLKRTLNEEELKSLAFFLLSYGLVLKSEDFDKIQKLNLHLREKGHSSDMMDLVEGKLSFQGVFDQSTKVTQFAPILDEQLFTDILSTNWLEEVARRTAVAKTEETIRKGIVYLSIIPPNNKKYPEAQMLLGNTWLDLENFSEATKCFLNTNGVDGFKLAAMSAFARVKNGVDWAYIAREEIEKQGERETRLLNFEELEKFTSREAFNLIMSEIHREP